MTRNIFKISYVALGMALSVSLAASAEKPTDKAGGKSLENQSQKAAERANSQWQEDATRGQARADQVRKHAEEATEDATDASEKAGKQAKDAEKRAKKEARGLAKDDDDHGDHQESLSDRADVKTKEAQGRIDESAKQPRGKARGFWGRWFGGDEEAEE